MFPDHLIHDPRPSSSSLRASTSSRNPHPTFSAHPPSVREQETGGRRDRPLPYAYTVLRSSPTTASLTHLASGRPVPPQNDTPFHVDSVGSAAGPSSHRAYPRASTSGGSSSLDPHDQFHTHPRALPPISPIEMPSSSSTRRAKSTSSRAIAYEHGEMIMDTSPDPRDGSLDPDDDGEGGMNGQLGTGQGKKHICPSCFKRFNRPSSLRIHVNTHTGATPFRCPWPNCGREFNVNSNMRRHYRNHTTPGAPRGSAAARSAGPPPPPTTRIPPPPPPRSGMSMSIQGDRGPTLRATTTIKSKSGPSSEEEEEFDELDSDMDVDPPPHQHPHPRASERQRGDSYPTPPMSSYASPRLHHSRSSPPPPPRRRGASPPTPYSSRERGMPYSYSPPSQFKPSDPRSEVDHHGRYPVPYECRREYSPHSSTGSPPSHSRAYRLTDRREYEYRPEDDEDEREEGKRVRRRTPPPRSRFRRSSSCSSEGEPLSEIEAEPSRDDDVLRKKEYQYNPSRPYEDAVKGRVSTVLRKAVY